MRLPPDLQFAFMHFMPYADLPEDHESYESLWVDYPNRLFDPEKGHQYYQRYMREMVLADRLGFDGVMVNEHHNTTYSLMPSCSVMAAALIPQIQQARILVFGTPVNLEHPNRLAEEYAMLDVLSRGRLVCAFPLGTGMEYWGNAASINPTTARARFRESMDIIVKAWTEDGPTQYEGEFYRYRYLNVWPKPYQRPHPPIYVVGSGSPETLDYAASHGFGYQMVMVPRVAQLKAFERYRETAAAHGHPLTPDKIGFNVLIYVAETDEIALREGKEHMLSFYDDFHRTTKRFQAPPGYVTVQEYQRRAAAPNVHGHVDWETVVNNGRVVLGSPDTVASKLELWIEESGSNRITCNLHFAQMPEWKTVKNLTLFAEEVMPRLRKLSGPAPAQVAA